MTEETLPPFPVDDLTLAGLEHALDYRLVRDPESDGEFPYKGEGADYSIHEFLDFVSGTTGSEGVYRVGHDGEPIDADEAARDDALGLDQVWVDERPHYTLNDVVRALIAEVRRLRGRVG